VNFIHHPMGRVQSTNTEARKLADAGAPEGTIVTAKEQQAGRGRAGRKWHSPPGNLYATLILRPKRDLIEVGSLSLVMALAIGRALGDTISYVDNWQLKWPNDVLVDGEKIAGVLLETELGSDNQLNYLIIGFGVNVENAPDVGDRVTTSLMKQGVENASVDVMRERICTNFAELYALWQEGGFPAVKDLWISHAQGFGCPVYLRSEKQDISGNFVDLSVNGAMVVENRQGNLHTIYAGDVIMAH
jgi:BirA family transcriptional regulator, biotin operon repressor / biotin---[acetyl-CoA-carboxylase] ligase